MNTLSQFELWKREAIDDPDLQNELNALNPKTDIDEINDRFYRDLEFGTGGLRGVIGAGTNRMNIYVIRKATQGLCSYLKQSGLPQSVAIAHDSRVKGRLFALEAARVLAANGITAYLYPRLEPTPALSWAVRYLGCGAGICVTASHNPAKYNGYKGTTDSISFGVWPVYSPPDGFPILRTQEPQSGGNKPMISGIR